MGSKRKRKSIGFIWLARLLFQEGKTIPKTFASVYCQEDEKVYVAYPDEAEDPRNALEYRKAARQCWVIGLILGDLEDMTMSQSVKAAAEAWSIPAKKPITVYGWEDSNERL